MDRLSRRERARRRAVESGGFTLIEVLVALGILATGLLTVAAAQLYAMKGGSSGRHTTDAATIAHGQIEDFQRMDFTDLNPTAGWAPAGGLAVAREVQGETEDLVEMTYTMQWRISNGPPNPRTGGIELKNIDVVVTWNEPGRDPRTVTLSTMRHDDPPSGAGGT